MFDRMLISSIPPSFGRIVFDLKVACAGPGWIPFALQPVTGQLSLSYQAARATQFEAAWGRYAQLPPSGVISELPTTSSQYVLAVEQRLGERSRFRAEAFDRQNEQRERHFSSFPYTAQTIGCLWPRLLPRLAVHAAAA